MDEWKPEDLCSLFRIKWEDTQLLAIANELNLGKIPASIAGGSLVRTLLGQDIFKGDIDIFPHTPKALEALIEKFSKERTWEKGKHAYNFELAIGVRKTKVQIITRDAPSTVGNTLNKFDLEHCKFAYFPVYNRIFASRAAPIALAKREVMLGFVREPNYTLGRIIKYKRLGFEADTALELVSAMAIKGMKDVQCCKEEKSGTIPFDSDDLETVVASCSS